MNLRTKFLTLSIKDQICLTIIFLTLFSVLVILCLSCSFSYEILNKDYKQKKLYFFDKYKDYLESCFFFQNYYLLQYEEMIKRIQKQIWSYLQTTTIFNEQNLQNNFGNTDNSIIEIFSSDINGNQTKKVTSKNNDILFYLCFSNYNGMLISSICNYVNNQVNNLYNSLSSLIASHEINRGLSIPELDAPILSSPLFVSVNLSFIFSFNASRINENIINICGGTNINYVRMTLYYNSLIEKIMNYIFEMFMYYYSDKLFLFNIMFGKVLNEIKNSEEVSIININDKNSYYEFVKLTCGYYSSIDYSKDKFFLISYVNGVYYYCETTIIDNFLYFMNNKLSLLLDISFIPLYHENNTIISPELCVLFILKQSNYQMEPDKIDEYYNKIIKGKSTIKDCFIKENHFNEQMKIKDTFDLNFYSFFTIKNGINQGLIETEKYPIYYAKYSYPNYNVLKEFQSDYLLLDQIDYYLFISFKEPIEFSNLVLQNCKNCFYLIIIIIVYSWLICFIINIIIFCKVIKQLTKPIIKLQEAIETSSIKDEHIFKYEYDDSINDLFLTCKELLTGQINRDNNEKGLGNFNILSIPKEKQYIDQNKYKKNLIINNNILNQILNEQQNMNDFSNNIKINEELNNNNEKDEKSPLILDNIIENKNISNKENEIKNEKNQIKNNEEKNRDLYKKLFQISDYFFYYRNKTEDNKIYIINNEIRDESQMSKIKNNQNMGNSSNTSPKNKKSEIKNDDTGNISINMLKNKNLAYLWYMEAKKRNNKSLNYYMGKNYDELFNDDDSYRNQQDNIRKTNTIK